MRSSKDARNLLPGETIHQKSFNTHKFAAILDGKVVKTWTVKEGRSNDFKLTDQDVARDEL